MDGEQLIYPPEKKLRIVNAMNDQNRSMIISEHENETDNRQIVVLHKENDVDKIRPKTLEARRIEE